MRYWLFKSEPDAYSWQRLQAEGRTPWSGVRNFVARNNMREMEIGDLGFFYHSSIAIPQIAGIVKVVKKAYPDFTAWEKGGEYYDPRSTEAKPLWYMVDVAPEADLPRPITLPELRTEPELAYMPLLQRGQRLSVQPVSPQEWQVILKMAKRTPAGLQ
ncbi:MAG: EVE domain-containing protein [Candidatus Eremiobacteraeota bacterium]|nr:EVE domain-containing protein [Candidatus Eremiobacteraeota bacterium]